MAKARTPEPLTGFSKKKTPPAQSVSPPKKREGSNRAPLLEKGNPEDDKLTMVQFQVPQKKRNEIKLFAITHGMTIKALMLMGYEAVQKTLTANEPGK